MKQDFIYTFRLMRSRPGYTLLTLAVLLSGLFVTLSTYSFLNVIAFKSLDLPNQHELVLGDLLIDGRRDKGKLDPYEARDIKDSQGIFKSIAFFSSSSISLAFNNESQGLNGAKVDSSFFDVVGVKPLKGRDILESDTLLGAPQVAVISYDLWQSTFLGKESIVGELVRINGLETEIVGIMPKGYAFPSAFEIWIPLIDDFSGFQRGDRRTHTMVGRLAEGVSVGEANKRASLIFQRLREQYPILNEGRNIFIEPVIMYETGPNNMSAFKVMLIAVFGILALACANAGGLLLARMGEREQEIAVRMAMGAKRVRIILQMMLESLILTTFAGIIALLLVDWYLEMINNLFANIGEPIPFWYNFDLDVETVLTAVLIILITTILSTLYPATKASGVSFNDVLKSGTRGAQSRQSGKLMKMLVSFEIIVASALVISSSIVIITNDRLSKIDFGIKTEQVLFANYALPEDLSGVGHQEERHEFQTSLRKALLGVQGVKHVSFANAIPSQEPWPKVFHETGEKHAHWTHYRRAYFVMADEYYFDALGIKLIAGRYPTDLDDHSETNKVLITESFSEQWWPDQDPLGKRFGSGIPEDADKIALEVIGVVSHVVLAEVGSSDMKLGTVFANHNKGKNVIQQILVTVDGDPYAYQKALKDVFYNINPDVGFTKIDSLNGAIQKENKQLTILNSFFAAFGLGALALSMTGIYAIMSLLVNQKKQEIGIRRALGATNNRVLWWLVKEGWTPVIVGLIVGVLLSAFFCYLLITQTELFNGVGALIPVVFFAGVVFYVAIAGLAIWAPSRDAIRNEPIYALRVE